MLREASHSEKISRPEVKPPKSQLQEKTFCKQFFKAVQRKQGVLNFQREGGKTQPTETCDSVCNLALNHAFVIIKV